MKNNNLNGIAQLDIQNRKIFGRFLVGMKFSTNTKKILNG